MLLAHDAKAQWTISTPPTITTGSLCIEAATGNAFFGAFTPPFGDCTTNGGFVGSVGTPANIDFGSGTVTAASLSDGAGTVVSGGVVTTNALNVTGQSNLVGGATVSSNLAANAGTTVNMGGNRVQNVGAPIASTDVANKDYVDQGLGWTNSRIDRAFAKIEETTEGIAVAMALGGLDVPRGKTFAIAASIGFYDGKEAIAAQTALRLSEYLTLVGGVGVGLDEGKVGGRVGITSRW